MLVAADRHQRRVHFLHRRDHQQAADFSRAICRFEAARLTIFGQHAKMLTFYVSSRNEVDIFRLTLRVATRNL